MFCEREREMWKGSQWNREIMSIFLKFSEECAKSNADKEKRVPAKRAHKEYWYLFEELPDENR